MIVFTKKIDPAKPVADKTDENRFDLIRKAAAEGHRKSGNRPTGGDQTPRKTEDNQPV